jgi:hypothetical protein
LYPEALYDLSEEKYSPDCAKESRSLGFEKDLCVVILTNATRFLNMRSGFKGYDYNEICKMRECIHNEILKDLQEQEFIL